MRIAVVHDWLSTYAGAERVTEQILRVYPEADVFAVVDFLPDGERGFLAGKRATTTFVQRLPLARRRFRWYLPLFPAAIERLDLCRYDLILSSSHAVAKGVRVRSGQVHACYCHTPMRYAWDMQEDYLAGDGLKALRRWLAKPLLNRLREWDRTSAERVTAFAANSRFIAGRIKRSYGRESTVIHPPVDVERFTPGAESDRGDFYVHVSRLVPYKRADLVVEAFRRMPEKKLVVIGDGPSFTELARTAPANVALMGRQSADAIRDHLRRAKALVFAGEEDFGIVLVEAMACGTPVAALGRGGALDSVLDGVTGVLFADQTEESVIGAVQRIEKTPFDREAIRRHAEAFSPERFRREFKMFVDSVRFPTGQP
jgi:glycosyltransferase involved in cell wall biosynthesis